MSLIPHTFLPRSMFDMDMWRQPQFGLPSTLDIFDPFDNLDRSLARNFQWLNNPFANTLQSVIVPQKYRIIVDCEGFGANSIKIDLSDDKRKLVVSGTEEFKENEENYTEKKFHRTFMLPDNIQSDQMASFMTDDNQLVIEFPLKQEELNQNGEISLLPRIVEDEKNKDLKTVVMDMNIPEGLDPKNIKVTCKDNDLIVQAEEKNEKPDGYTRTYFYRRCTLPENTNFEALKCFYDDDHKLSIKAPLSLEHESKGQLENKGQHVSKDKHHHHHEEKAIRS